jgi:hypothetical protein
MSSIDMHDAMNRIVRRGASLAMAALLAACSPNALLGNLQDQVLLTQKANGQTTPTPSISPVSGRYQSDQSVFITATPGAVIYYTTAAGGTMPTDPTSYSPVFSAPFAVAGNGTIVTVKAIATKAGMIDSSVVTSVYTIVYPTYTVTYSANGDSQGSPPVDGNLYHQGDKVTVLGNTGSLRRFQNWNTTSNGYGTNYNGGTSFSMGAANVILYAVYY